jgi:hypothetical protein
VLLCGFLLAAIPSHGSLGGDEASVKADLDHVQGTIRNTQRAAYRLHEIRTRTGIAVREYVSPSGTVFAVAWKGPWQPDLKQLLGSHFSEYQQALQTSSRSGVRGPFAVRVSNLVVELSGHMRSFSGRAYLTDQVPAGISLESIH